MVCRRCWQRRLLPSAGFGSVLPNADNWLGVVEQEYELNLCKRRITFARGAIAVAPMEIVIRTMHLAQASFRSVVPGGLVVLYMCTIACPMLFSGMIAYLARFNTGTSELKQSSATRILLQRLVLLAHLHSMNNVLFWIFASDEVRALTPECSPQQNVFAPIVLYTVGQACFLGQVSVYQFLLWVPHLVAVVSDAVLRSRGAPEVDFLPCTSWALLKGGSLWLVCVLAPLVVSFLWTPLRTRASWKRFEREIVSPQAAGCESCMSNGDSMSIQSDEYQDVSSVKSGSSASWGNVVLDVVSLASRGSDANSYDSEFNPVPPGEFNPNPDYLKWCGSDRDSIMSDSATSSNTDRDSIGILEDYEPESYGSCFSEGAQTVLIDLRHPALRST
jgi:hypothetical protein